MKTPKILLTTSLGIAIAGTVSQYSIYKNFGWLDAWTFNNCMHSLIILTLLSIIYGNAKLNNDFYMKIGTQVLITLTTIVLAGNMGVFSHENWFYYVILGVFVCSIFYLRII